MPYKYPEDDIVYNRFWYLKNRDWINCRQKNRYISDPDHRKIKIVNAIQWNKDNPKRRKEICKKSDKKNRQHKTRYQIEYRKRTPEKTHEYNIRSKERKHQWYIRKNIFNTFKNR